MLLSRFSLSELAFHRSACLVNKKFTSNDHIESCVSTLFLRLLFQLRTINFGVHDVVGEAEILGLERD